MAPQTPARARPEQWVRDREYHESLFDREADTSQRPSSVNRILIEEIRTVPLFSANILKKVSTHEGEKGSRFRENTLTQYGLLAKIERSDLEEKEREGTHRVDAAALESETLPLSSGQIAAEDDRRLFINVNTPWSAFICGSQGACSKPPTLLSAGLRKRVTENWRPAIDYFLPTSARLVLNLIDGPELSLYILTYSVISVPHRRIADFIAE